MKWVKVLVIIFITLTGCQSSQKLMPPANVIEFTTRPSPEPGIPAEVLKRAANTAHRRGYSYFTATQVTAPNAKNWRPTISIDYGRSPYGFSDPGSSFPGGLSTDSSVEAARTKWIIQMFHPGEINVEQAYAVSAVLG